MEVVVENHITKHTERNGLLYFARDREQQSLRLFRFENRLALVADGRDEYGSVGNVIAADVAHAFWFRQVAAQAAT